MKQLIIITGCLLAICVVAYLVLLRSVTVFFAEDAVLVIALEASKIFQENPDTTDEDMDTMIKYLHESSVINLKIDQLGNAVVPFGTAFRVEHRIESDVAITTVTSGGPDREFGTDDDIYCSRLKNPAIFNQNIVDVR